MVRFLPVLACVLALCGAAIAGCGGGDAKSAAPSEAKARAELAGSPPPLAALHAQANKLIGGGSGAFKERLAQLEGHPVIVNKWASWCPPCRQEFPYLQRQALRHGKRIAFLGVDANDNDGDAAKFLADFPVTYPSYTDPDLKVSAVFNGVAAFPTTAYYDSKGELAYVKQGVYLNEGDFESDIERYAR